MSIAPQPASHLEAWYKELQTLDAGHGLLPRMQDIGAIDPNDMWTMDGWLCAARTYGWEQVCRAAEDAERTGSYDHSEGGPSKPTALLSVVAKELHQLAENLLVVRALECQNENERPWDGERMMHHTVNIRVPYKWVPCDRFLCRPESEAKRIRFTEMMKLGAKWGSEPIVKKVTE